VTVRTAPGGIRVRVTPATRVANVAQTIYAATDRDTIDAWSDPEFDDPENVRDTYRAALRFIGIEPGDGSIYGLWAAIVAETPLTDAEAAAVTAAIRSTLDHVAGRPGRHLGDLDDGQV